MKHSLGYFFMACLMPMLATAVFATPPAKRPPVPVPTVPVPTVLDMGLYTIPVEEEQQAQPIEVTINVTLKDLGKPNVILDVYQLDMDAGGTGTVYVSLSAAPTGNVTVTIGDTYTDVDLEISPASLDFTTDNWNTTQAVTLTADDLTAGQNEAGYWEVVSFHASGGSYVSVIPELAVYISEGTGDDRTEDINLVVAQNGTPITELEIDEGSSETVQVSLSAAPGSNVDVTISTFYTGVYATVSITPTGTLTFTPDNWDNDVNVTITALQDPNTVDGGDIVTFASTSPGLTGISEVQVRLTIPDDDQSQFVVLTPTEINENSTTNLVYISMDVAPDAGDDVTWTVSGHTGTTPSLTLNATSWTFSSTNYTEGKEIQIGVGQDLRRDNVDIVLTFTAVGGGTAIEGQVVTKTITIIDTWGGGLDVTASAIDILEGFTGTFGVVLTRQPDGPVTVAINVPIDADLTLDTDRLTFTTTNWDTYQYVIITTTRDSDLEDDPVPIHMVASGGGYSGNFDVTPIQPVVNQ